MGAAVSAAVQGQWASFDLVKDRYDSATGKPATLVAG